MLELVRGDGKRPYALGLSAAQWVAVATALGCAAWRSGMATGGLAMLLAIAATGLLTQRHRRALLLPPHLFR